MDIQQLYATNKEIKGTDLKQLENWMRTQPHLPKFDARMIFMIFHACELSLERTKKCIEYYYTVRTSFPAMFSDRDPESPHKLQQLQLAFCEPLSKLNPNGHVICYGRFMQKSAANYDFCTHLKLLDMRLHAYMLEFGCTAGGELILDLDSFSWRHWTKFNLLKAAKALGYLANGFPVRVKGMHIVHPVPFFSVVMNFVNRFIPKELQQLIKIHNKLETLFDALPEYCIPNELGGTGGSVEELHRSYVESIMRNRDYFIEDEQMKSDESKRVKVGFFQRFGL